MYVYVCMFVYDLYFHSHRRSIHPRMSASSYRYGISNTHIKLIPAAVIAGRVMPPWPEIRQKPDNVSAAILCEGSRNDFQSLAYRQESPLRNSFHLNNNISKITFMMYVYLCMYVCIDLVSALGDGGGDGQLGGASSGQHTRIKQNIPHNLRMYVYVWFIDRVYVCTVCIYESAENTYAYLHGVL